MSSVKVVNADGFENEVLKANQPVLVDFWAPWCGPCKMLGPIVDVVATENQEKLMVAKINVDENKSLASQYGIRSIPTLLFFKDGKEIKRVVGAQSKPQLQKMIDQIVG